MHSHFAAVSRRIPLTLSCYRSIKERWQVNFRSSQLGKGCSSNDAGDGPVEFVVLVYQGRSYLLNALSSVPNLAVLTKTLLTRTNPASSVTGTESQSFRFTYLHPTLRIPIDLSIDADLSTALNLNEPSITVTAEDIAVNHSPNPITTNVRFDRSIRAVPFEPPSNSITTNVRFGSSERVDSVQPPSNSITTNVSFDSSTCGNEPPCTPSRKCSTTLIPQSSPQHQVPDKGLITPTLSTGHFVSVCTNEVGRKAHTVACIIGKRSRDDGSCSFTLQPITHTTPLPSFTFNFKTELHGVDGACGGWRSHRTKQQATCFSTHPEQAPHVNNKSFYNDSLRVRDYNKNLMRDIPDSCKATCPTVIQLVQLDDNDRNAPCGYAMRCNICYLFGNGKDKATMAVQLDNYKTHCQSYKHKVSNCAWRKLNAPSSHSALDDRLRNIRRYLDPLEIRNPTVYNLLSIDRVTGEVASSCGTQVFMRGNPTSEERNFHLWPSRIQQWAARSVGAPAPALADKKTPMMAWLNRKTCSPVRKQE